MATLNKLNEIAALDWLDDTENEGGYFAAVTATERADLRAKLERAGYEVSNSEGNIDCDDEGQHYLWVMGEPVADQDNPTRYVRLGTDGYYYRPEIVEEYDDPEFCVEPIVDVIKIGPSLGNAALPADVQAARWAAERNLPYRG